MNLTLHLTDNVTKELIQETSSQDCTPSMGYSLRIKQTANHLERKSFVVNSTVGV